MGYSTKTKAFTCEMCGIEGQQNIMGATRRFCSECYPKQIKEIESKRWKSDSYRKANQNGNYLKKYGITLEQYEEIHRKQNGKCAICFQEETSVHRGKVRVLSVDHDHSTGKIRGLLCRRCNLGLGGFEDNIQLLSTCIEYLERN